LTITDIDRHGVGQTGLGGGPEECPHLIAPGRLPFPNRRLQDFGDEPGGGFEILGRVAKLQHMPQVTDQLPAGAAFPEVDLHRSLLDPIQPAFQVIARQIF
jgi:hypothetical protein